MATQQRDRYLLAWAEWVSTLSPEARKEAEAIRPSWSDPTTDRRPIKATKSGADRGTRQAPSRTDEARPMAMVLAAEVIEAREADTLTMAGLADALRAFDRLATTMDAARMMGHDTSPKLARLADPLGDDIGHGVATLAVETRQGGHRVATARQGQGAANVRPKALAASLKVRNLPAGTLADVSTRHTRQDAARKEARQDEALELAEWAAALHGPNVRAEWRKAVKAGRVPTFVTLAEAIIGGQ